MVRRRKVSKGVKVERLLGPLPVESKRVLPKWMEMLPGNRAGVGIGDNGGRGGSGRRRIGKGMTRL